jgi:hypothetical protein
MHMGEQRWDDFRPPEGWAGASGVPADVEAGLGAEPGWYEAPDPVLLAEARIALPVTDPELVTAPELVPQVEPELDDAAPQPDQSATVRRLRTALVVVSALLVLAAAVLAGVRFHAPWARSIVAPVATAVRMPDGQIGPAPTPSTSVAPDGSTTVSVPQFGSVTLPAGVTAQGYEFFVDEQGGQSLIERLSSGFTFVMGWVGTTASSPDQLKPVADQWASDWGVALVDSSGAVVTSPNGNAGWCVQATFLSGQGCFYPTASQQITCYIWVSLPSTDSSMQTQAQALVDTYIPGD